MTRRAGSGDRQDEPDPKLFEQFCRAFLPGALADVCHVEKELAAQVGEDVLARGESYAALEQSARDVLIAPFAEEVARYEPAEAPLELLGAVAVVVRSSMLEEAHAHGPVEARDIKSITSMAAAPLSHLLAARRRNPVAVNANLFADLAAAHPRAWACLGAVALAHGADGGRWPYRVPAVPIPELPVAVVEARRAANIENSVILSGVDTGFDELLVQRMRELAEHAGAVFLIASLSRISRHLDKLMQVIEYLLAHDVPILTANYLLRSDDVWVRRGAMAPIDVKDPLAAWRMSRGLSGAHRATAAWAVRELEAGNRATGTDTPSPG